MGLLGSYIEGDFTGGVSPLSKSKKRSADPNDPGITDEPVSDPIEAAAKKRGSTTRDQDRGGGLLGAFLRRNDSGR